MSTKNSPQLLDDARTRVRELITTAPFYRQGLLEIAALLPECDDELHGWLEEMVAERSAPEFIFVTCAAALAGRRLRASLLPGGTMLMPDPWRFAGIAWHMEGDVTENLLAALKRQGINPQTEAMLLFVAAAWWQKHRTGEIPRPIVSAGRSLQRRAAEIHKDAQSTLAALQVLTGDAGMLALSPMARFPKLRGPAIRMKEALLAAIDRPFSDHVPEKREHAFRRGTPMRRSVEDVGRNDPCRCGSGLKYKKCCEKTDRKRLQLSTDVAGKTWVELQDDPDSDLTLARLQRLEPATLGRLDPTRVSPDFLPEYLMRLAAFGLFDDLAAAYEKLGVTEDLEPLWKRLFLFVIRAWRRDAAQRMVEAHPRGIDMLPETEPGLRLLLASADGASFLEALEKEALAALESNDREEMQSLALAFLASPYKALGIFFTRSLLPLDGLELSFLFEQILHTRDALCLREEDEFGDFVEERVAGRRQADDSPALREAREEHDRKAAEVRRVREELGAARRQLALAAKREKRSDAATVVAGHAPRAEDEAIQKLRAREKELEALLRDRRQERLTQRREIEKLRQEVALLRAGETGAATAEEAHEAEDEGGETLQSTAQQPLRLLAFPKRFREKLDAFPPQVGRAVMTQLGRIASGDPTAFASLKRLQECEELVRARVAGDYRLLMHFTSEYVQVVDVVNRRDLQKRLRTLRATGLPVFLAYSQG